MIFCRIQLGPPPLEQIELGQLRDLVDSVCSENIYAPVMRSRDL